MRTQAERAEVAGFGYKQAGAANAEYKRIAKAANSMYDMGSEKENINAYMRDLPIRKQIQSGEFPLFEHKGRQNKHIAGTKEYVQYVERMRKDGRYGPSRITISGDDVRDLVNTLAENGRDIEAAKKPFADYEAVKDRLKTAEDGLKAFANVDVSKLQGEISRLKDALAQKDTDWQAKIDGMVSNK